MSVFSRKRSDLNQGRSHPNHVALLCLSSFEAVYDQIPVNMESEAEPMPVPLKGLGIETSKGQALWLAAIQNTTPGLNLT